MVQQTMHTDEDLCRQGSLLRCLFIAAVALGVADAERMLAEKYPPGYVLTAEELPQAAKRVHLRVRNRTVAAEELAELPIPAIAKLRDGRYAILGRSNQRKILIFYPETTQPVLTPYEELQGNWSGQVFLLEKVFHYTDFARKFNFSWFLPVLQHYKPLFRDVLIASFFLQIFGIMMPLFTQVVVDKVIGNRGLSTLDVLTMGLVVAGLFQAAMGILRTYLLTHTTNKVDVILGARLFRHVLALPLPYFETRRVGDTLMRMGAMNSIREFLTGSALTSFLDAGFVVVFLAIMLYYSVPLTVLALLAIPVYLAQNILATPVYQRKLQEVWSAGSENNSFLVEAVTGIHTIKSMALEPQFNHRWEGLLARYVKTTFNSGVLNMFLNNSGSLIEKLSGFAVLGYGGYLVMQGQLTLGQLIAFQMLSGQASAPLLRLVSLWQTVQQAVLSMERLGDILHTRPENIRPTQGGTLEELKGDILLDNVVFRYRPDADPVLQGVSLQMAAGSRIGIVGRSGSGKSTLTKLIQCLYHPEAGSVSIDGIKTAEIDPSWLRRQIGVVLQENFLFNGSVRENIAAAAPSAPMEAIIRVAQLAGAHEFILELPEGYDTKVGERGTALSGGQRQRIAIARALLTNPKVLIFDEATSALDYESERIIMQHLDGIAAQRTMIMIAHRLSTVRHCDCIFVIDKGRLVEQGSHEELLALQGVYYQLHLQQEG
ncbi:MAG: type I secretion system permease/ATPase [Anaeromusa sp.]|uniref:peptidase domain-containing ABC transporter n=1 Tax=Anaeromusa sp. TaxID=1872520 RepID=UPI002B1F4A21|nr:type I secretion system permease/ATPase [Anaeromusa sp.]MEA4836636.1 type I secretion system permease/ATPase [Anaeromusa sp.]